MFHTLLIANRGEIACRVIATARRLGIRTVAVYSDADAQARHVRLADSAVRLGPAAATDSYLAIGAVLEAARASGAQAIHPGYGFLSENAQFARRCGQAGLVFVGPPAEAIEAMGAKDAAKRLVVQADVPVVPGYDAPGADDAHLIEAAGRIGYPLLVKAAAGGGGRGMRRVDSAAGLADAIASARREALAAFGDDTLLLERYVTDARHVEVQVFADAHGAAVHLFERDCSVQRRHQKVVEEAPAPNLPDATRAAMGAAAVRAAQAVGYRGAGTVEFLLAPDGAFYFLEMNTRLQVEHPVTEAITGLDLVEWQLRVAAGEPLPLAQPDIRRHGHAIEVRLCAEDPARGFLPGVGRLDALALPAPGPGRRVDTGFEHGDTVSPHYDSLLAKLIAWGDDREQARTRLLAMLGETTSVGVASNTALLERILATDDFAAVRHHTGWLEGVLDDLTAPAAPTVDALLAATVRLTVDEHAAAPAGADDRTPWALAGPFRVGVPAVRRVQWHTIDGASHTVTLTGRNDGGYQWQCGEQAGALAGTVRDDTVTVDGPAGRQAWRVWRHGQHVELAGPQRVRLQYVDPLAAEAAEDEAELRLTAPLPGKLVQVAVAPGQSVAKGDLLLVLEAMKMEHRIHAPHDGVIETVGGQTGDFVPAEAVLVSFVAGDA
ncbi:acetyl/propionyl/methylcrotonyl-CoA carboxylase subunit alpha [Immundisolibacter sp.]|uniref:acetyl/propionyl/methylcrotonyl-CoA carboxylase subunit alpha n=1 Tax=Immundisolibacter sp. TaxID=1934948 RepID=UPI003F8296C2